MNTQDRVRAFAGYGIDVRALGAQGASDAVLKMPPVKLNGLMRQLGYPGAPGKIASASSAVMRTRVAAGAALLHERLARESASSDH